MDKKFKIKVQPPDFQSINYEEMFYPRDSYLDQEIVSMERFVH